MKIEIGNANVVDVVVSESGEMAYTNLEGERVTTFMIPDGTAIGECFQIVLAGMPRHINPTARPWWVECDDGVLQTMLLDHFGLPRSTARPSNWGDGATTAATPVQAVQATKKATAKKAAAPKKEEE